MEKIAADFLQHLGLRISRRYVEKIVSSHADYPSLLSIADALERLGIEYKAWRIKKEEIKDIPFPYLLPLASGSNGDIVLIKNKDALQKNAAKLEYWDGVILCAKASERINDEENNRLYVNERLFRLFTIILIGATVSLLLLPFIERFSWTIVSLLTTALIGVVVGYLILAKDLGIKYSAIESFCNGGKNVNCDKILNSESKILGIAKFSELVAIYFGFQLIILSSLTALSNTKASFFLVLFIISLCTFPVILYSLYYQFKEKVWCMLCLIVNAILITQLAIFTYSKNLLNLSEVDMLTISLSLIIFFIVAASVLITKGVLERTNRLEQAEIKSSRVKNSASVFLHLLLQQRKVDSTPLKPELMIGSANAPVEIIIVSNLYCNPCKVKHKLVSELVKKYPNRVNLSIRITIRSMQSEFGPIPGQYILQYWLHNIYGKENELADTEKMMTDWYNLMDLEKFKRKYTLGENDNEEEAISLAEQHHHWLIDTNISRTPTFFVNGYELPQSYNIEDLENFIVDLSDRFQKIKNKLEENVFQNM